MTRSRALALVVFLLTLIIVLNPGVSFRASLDGLKLWFDVVLPALLPFFILADLLRGLGIVHFLGALLEPVMRPLFRIPGVGGFALAMSLAAGYPMGAKIAGDLARDGLLTSTEAERLMGLAHTANSSFIMGAVAVGMFGRPELGITLLLAHYLGALLVGFCLRLHKGPESPAKKGGRSYLQNAVRALDKARQEDGRSLGQLFRDAVKDTFQSLFFIGGCIILFSVIVQVITAAGLLTPIQAGLGLILSLVGLDPNLASAFLTGFFETTLGSQTAARTVASVGARATAASFLLGWSGLSVHGQAAAMLGGSRVRFAPFIYARALHGIFAAMLTALLLGPASFIPTSLSKALPVVGDPQYLNGTFGARLLASARLATSFLLIVVVLLTLVWLVRRIIYISLRRA